MKTKTTAQKPTNETNGAHGPSLENGDPEDSPVVAESRAAQAVLDRDEAQEVQAILNTMRNEGGQGAYIRLLVKRRLEPKYSYLTKLPLDAFEEETIKQNYGGGDYIAEGRKAGGAIVKTYRFSISHDIPAKNPDAAKPEAPKTDVAEIVKMVATQIIPLIKPAAAPDNTAMILAMLNSQTQMAIEQSKSQAQMMATMFGAMNKPAPTTDPAIVQLMNKMERAIEKLSDAQHSPKEKSGAAELLELLEVIDRVKDSSAPSEDKGGMFAKLGEVLGPIVKATLAGGAQFPANAVLLDPASPTSAPPAPISQPAPAMRAENGTATGAPQPDQTQSMNFAFNQAMRTFAARAIQAAQMKMTPEDFADAAEAQVPPAYDERIFALVTDEKWFEKIFGAQARAEEFRPWLTKVRDIFVEDFDPKNQEEEDEPSPAN